jgi:hypothetical protein
LIKRNGNKCYGASFEGKYNEEELKMPSGMASATGRVEKNSLSLPQVLPNTHLPYAE